MATIQVPDPKPALSQLEDAIRAKAEADADQKISELLAEVRELVQRRTPGLFEPCDNWMKPIREHVLANRDRFVQRQVEDIVHALLQPTVGSMFGFDKTDLSQHKPTGTTVRLSGHAYEGKGELVTKETGPLP